MATKNLPPQAHAIAGAIGGAFATWLFYPLELLRVEMQRKKKNSPQHQHEDEGVEEDSNQAAETNLECFIRLYKQQSLYRGSSSMITTMLLSSYITFYALEVIRQRMSILKLQGGAARNTISIQKQQHQIQNHIKFLYYILPKSKVASSLLASTITGIINVLLTTPLWNGTRRIMEMEPPSGDVAVSTQAHQEDGNRQIVEEESTPSLFQMMYKIANNEGVSQLWHGTLSSLLLVSNPAIQYFIYEQIRVWVLGIKNRSRIMNSSSNSSISSRRRTEKMPIQMILQLTAMEAFVFGALSKTIATVVTYPLQLGQMLIRIRKNEVQDMKEQCSNKDSDKVGVDMDIEEYNGMIDCLYQQFTHNNGGFASLFAGMSSKLVQTVGQASFIFVTYEQMLALVGKVIKPR